MGRLPFADGFAEPDFEKIFGKDSEKDFERIFGKESEKDFEKNFDKNFGKYFEEKLGKDYENYIEKKFGKDYEKATEEMNFKDFLNGSGQAPELRFCDYRSNLGPQVFPLYFRHQYFSYSFGRKRQSISPQFKG